MASSSSFFSGTNPTPTEYQTAVDLVAQATQKATAALASQEASAASAQSSQGYSVAAGNSATSAANQASAAATSAAGALTYKTAAETAATNAATSATNAASSNTSAGTSATNAAASAATATTQATAASTSATNAASSSSAAGTSATNAANSASGAATSASNAATSATTATNQATAAGTSATNAANSASAASTSATNAATSATSASGSATTATTQATNASNSASAASTSATNASNSASAASTSATNAASSATAAATSASNAASTLAGALTKTDNLASLSDVGTARTNLGLTALATTTPGTNVATALGVAVGSAGAFVTNGGALGTPSSGNLANCTFPTLNQNTTGTAAGLSSTLVVGSGGTGTGTAFTAGSVVFAGASGVYSQNNSNLFWDNSNARLGIATGTPSYALDVVNNNLSIPAARLFGNDQNNVRLRFENVGVGARTWEIVGGLPGLNNSAFSIYDVTGSTTRLSLNTLGSLGLGVTPSSWSGPAYELIGGALWSNANSIIYTTQNTYFDGTNFLYKTAQAASYTRQFLGTWAWFTSNNTPVQGGAVSFTQAMTLDASGNLGLGVTPSAWSSSFKAFEIGALGSGISVNASNGNLITSSNSYANSSNINTYARNGYSCIFNVKSSDGSFAWSIAPSGTAGNPISFTQAMTLDASGNLLVATTTNHNTRVAIKSSSTNQHLVFEQENSSTDGWGIRNYGGGGGNLEFSRMTSTTTFTPAMTLNASGNLGIGTTTNNVFDAVAAARPLIVQSSSSATFSSSPNSTNSIVICNSDTTTGNSSQLTFAAITGASASQFASAAINCIYGARTNGQYPTGILTFSTSTALNNAPSEKMRIDNAGNVGVGTSNPSAEGTNIRLAVVGGAAQAASTLATANSNAGFSVRGNSSSGYQLAMGAIVTSGYPYIQGLNWNGGAVSSELIIQPFGGNVGIGTTSPAQKLAISNGGAQGIEISPIATASAPAIVCYNRSTSAYIGLSQFASKFDWYIGSSPAMTLDASSNVGINTTSTSFGKLAINSVPSSQWSIDLAPPGSNNLITLANNAIYDMLPSCSGMILLQENSGLFAAIVMCQYGNVSIVWQYGSVLSNAGVNTAGKLNLYYNAPTNSYRFQNLYGSTLYPIICSFKTRNSA